MGRNNGSSMSSIGSDNDSNRYNGCLKVRKTVKK